MKSKIYWYLVIVEYNGKIIREEIFRDWEVAMNYCSLVELTRNKVAAFKTLKETKEITKDERAKHQKHQKRNPENH